jgi:opacity protein-like surface antigen
MRLFLISLCSAAALAAAAPAHAQAGGPGPLEATHMTFTPFVGGAFGGDLDGGTLGVGAAASYNWDSRISLEGEFSLLPSTGEDQFVNVDASAWDLSANLLYHFTETTRRALIPYVTAGLGVAHAGFDIKDNTGLFDNISDSSTALAINLGAGVKKRLSDRTSVRGDFRYFTGNDLAPDFARVYAGLGFDLGTR